MSNALTELIKGEYSKLEEWIDECSISTVRNELSLVKFPVFFCQTMQLYQSQVSECLHFFMAFRNRFALSFAPILDELYTEITMTVAADKDEKLKKRIPSEEINYVFLGLFCCSQFHITVSEESAQLFETFLKLNKLPKISSVITFAPHNSKTKVYVSSCTVSSSTSPNGLVDNSRCFGFLR